MARPRIRPDETATTDRLLEAAALEFADRGFEGARLADIAERIGITRPSLLYHFASKQELYSAVIQDVFAELGGALAEGTRVEGQFFERFDSVVKRLVTFFDARTEIATLILREIVDAKGPGHALLLEAGVPILQRIEKFVREEGRGLIRAELPVRAALLQIFSNVLVRAASGSLREPLWGKQDKTRAIARTMFFEGSDAWTSEN